MQPTLEQLLADIYTLDASLRERDAEVRVLVEQLLAEKPTIAINTAFKARLRSELLKKQPVVATAAKTLPWWLFYATPVGVAAILILMLVPEYTKTQAPFVPTVMPTSIEEYAPVADEALFMNVPVDSPAAKRGVGVTSENEMSTFGVAADMVTPDSLFIGTQEAGQVVLVESALLSAPAYVVIQEVGKSDAVLGMSAVLLPGELLPFTITLETPLLASGTYEAVLYTDNGDELRDTTLDAAVLSIQFTVSPR